jgi:hypothetical protein
VNWVAVTGAVRAPRWKSPTVFAAIGNVVLDKGDTATALRQGLVVVSLVKSMYDTRMIPGTVVVSPTSPVILSWHTAPDSHWNAKLPVSPSMGPISRNTPITRYVTTVEDWKQIPNSTRVGSVTTLAIPELLDIALPDIVHETDVEPALVTMVSETEQSETLCDKKITGETTDP